MKFSLALLAMLACLFAAPDFFVQAQAAGNPYEATVTVKDDSPRSKRDGLRKALFVVLKRVVGHSDERTRRLLDQAGRLVLQYNFLYEVDSEEVKFNAVFDAHGVEAAAKAVGLPVFGIDPNLVEAWIIEVHGVRDAGDYSGAIKHFKGISGVRRLEVAQLQDDTLRLRMIVEGGVKRASGLAQQSGLVQQQGEDIYVYIGR